MDERRTERGQGLLEMAVILPVLLILMLGVAEIGYALRDYLIVANANREGCRFAARGRFSDSDIGGRVVIAGGGVLRTDIGDADPNTGIIITYIEMDRFGDVPVYNTPWVSGVIPSEAGGVQLIMAENSMITATLYEIVERHRVSTQSINATREAAMYEPMDNHVVIVEVFFIHHPLFNNPLLPLPDPWTMHAQTEMRVTTSRE